MKHRLRAICVLLSVVLCRVIHAQSRPSQTADQAAIAAHVAALFDSMKSGDTAQVRRAFAASGRVVVIPASTSADAPILPVDAFVKFAAQQPAGSWIERALQSTVHVDGMLATMWFAYDVHHGAEFGQCGTNSVQLQRAPDGWKILSMAFTSRTTDCPTRKN